MTPSTAKAMFLRLWKSKGETVRLRKDSYDGSSVECDVRAVVSGFSPQEITSGIEAGDRKILAYADDLTTGFGEPSNGDVVILRRGKSDERHLVVNDPDTSTHRLGGVLVAIAFRGSGAA